METKNIQGLSPSDLERITAILHDLYHPVAIYIFGSTVWGSPDNNSDVDIAVILKSSNLKNYQEAQKGILALWELKKGVDLLVYTESEFQKKAEHPSSLQHKILTDGIKIYEAA